MIVVVFYDPTDGEILECTVNKLSAVVGDGRPYIEVDQYRANWAETHLVIAGQLVEKED